MKSASVVATKAGNKTLHKETMMVLENYQRKADAAIKALRPVEHGRSMTSTKSTKFDDLLKHKDAKNYCTKVAFVEENYSFLLFMKKSGNKGNQAVYDLFIKPSAKFEINIDSPLRDKFREVDDSASPKKWEDAPWAAAVDEIESLTLKDTIGKFKKWLMEQETKNVFAQLP